MEQGNEDGRRNSLLFYLNGKKVIHTIQNTNETLLEYLRSPRTRLNSAKLSCGEGGCGACTVMLSTYDRTTQNTTHAAVNACITPLVNIDGCAVVTTEGIGNVAKLHPIQERLAQFGASQCGFCTPGIAMSLYAYLRAHPHASGKEIEECLDGNLCRCTGYRPIIAAAKSLVENPPGVRVCPSTGKPCECGSGGSQDLTTEVAPEDRVEPIFPPALKNYKPASLYISDVEGREWYRPTTLAELTKLKSLQPSVQLYVGATEVTINAKYKNVKYMKLAHVGRVEELLRLRITEEGVFFGAAMSLTRVSQHISTLVASAEDPSKLRSLIALKEQLRWFAGTQIRNTATMVGNLVTASPISDLNPVFIAAGARVVVQTDGEAERHIPINADFFTGYRTTSIRPSDVVIAIFLPFTTSNQYIMSYKQSKRREDDLAIVSASFFVEIIDRVISCARLSYGGVSFKTVEATITSNALVGRPWDEETLKFAFCKLKEELVISDDAPGGVVPYRRALVPSLFFKFYLFVQSQVSSIHSVELSAIESFHRPSSFGKQVYHIKQDDAPVGQPIMHVAALKHATGEAIFTDDIVPASNELRGVFLFSNRAHAKIIRIDASAALDIPGVVALLTEKDLPGPNVAGLVSLRDEPIFASGEVHACGQFVGLMLAETHQLAKDACKLVHIEYEDLPAILTIEAAIRQKSFFSGSDRALSFGDTEVGFSESDVVVEGTVCVGGQDHFYMEPQTCLALPGEEKEIVVWTASQNPHGVQESVSHALGIPMNRVEIKIKRLGGGFGGKETRSIPLAVASSIAAKKLGRPVRIVMDREDNMRFSPGRHPIMAEYKVGFAKTGKIKALDVKVFVDGGYCTELSPVALELILLQIDAAYFVPNFKAWGTVCRTNYQTPTVMRATGRTQQVIITETIIDHIASACGLPRHVVQEINLYQIGELTPFKKPVEGCDIRGIWKKIVDEVGLEARISAIEEFNRANKYKKRGYGMQLAFVPTKYGCGFTPRFLNQGSALVHLERDGTVLLYHGGCEMGQGLHTKMIQIAAKSLGMPIENIHVLETTTSAVINASPTAASFSTDLLGPAVKNACDELATRIKPVRDELGEGWTWSNIARQAYLSKIDCTARGYARGPDIDFDWDKGEGDPMQYYTCGTSYAEVEVDILTGSHMVLHVSIVMDVGRSINPIVDIGQIEGGFMIGQGIYTTEQLIYDTKGVLVTCGPSQYKIPSVGDVPVELNVTLYKESPNPVAIYSSRAIGEPPVPLAASVFFAIKDAIYKSNPSQSFIRLDSPATCDKILYALGTVL